MADLTLGVVEEKFADIIWQNEPITTSELVKLCAVEFNWKKSTTFTVLKRLCLKGIFISENTVVRSLIKKNELYSMRSERFVEETFGGSLPAFISAFASRKELTAEEIAEIQRIIDSHKS